MYLYFFILICYYYQHLMFMKVLYIEQYILFLIYNIIVMTVNLELLNFFLLLLALTAVLKIFIIYIFFFIYLFGLYCNDNK